MWSNRLALFYLALFNIVFSKDIVPKRYSVNLNLVPELRWSEIIEDHQDIIPFVIQEAK